MRLYEGSSSQFITDCVHNQISGKLEEAFLHYFRYKPAPSEVQSWRHSLSSVAHVFRHADLMDHGVVLEYQLPTTSKRLDCMITGQDEDNCDHAVIIELKQWEACQPADGANEVLTWVGGAEREVLHPSAQVGQYRMYLADGHTAFYDGVNPIGLQACAYLHNYTFSPDDTLLLPRYQESVSQQPLFSANDVDGFHTYLRSYLCNGNGTDTLRRFLDGRYRPSKKLMRHVADVIKGKPEYVLLDEQLIAFDRVVAAARKGFHTADSTVIIVKGGPGTGKSVIALNLMGDLLAENYNAHYATGSQAFTQTLQSIIGKRGSVQFKYFNSYMRAEHKLVDVLICDEAHRIRKTSNNRFTKKENQSKQAQIEELLDVAKVAVFFIDDDQVVRPNEIGSVSHIREFAEQHGSAIYEYELQAQFRCSGSDAFVNWVNNTLGIHRTATPIWGADEEFEFRILEDPATLDMAIREKVEQEYTARLTAGFCWEWSKHPNADGTLKHDVTIGEWSRAWNARPEATRLAKGIPKAPLWANDEGGMEQVGCIYTAQGFEFDYVGVIFGTDLVYDLDAQSWVGRKENSHDTVVKRSKDQFVDLVKNTYRVLLSRGLKGCYVCFLDKDTERYFKSRVDMTGQYRAE